MRQQWPGNTAAGDTGGGRVERECIRVLQQVV